MRIFKKRVMRTTYFIYVFIMDKFCHNGVMLWLFTMVYK
jgi:hypothetical protein